MDRNTAAVELKPIHLPTEFGEFKITAYESNIAGEQPTVVIYKGETCGKENVLVRFHSECLTGDILRSQRCDCGPQLEQSLRMIEEEGLGVVIYLRQEGRGIGLVNKLKAYYLQEQGYDTVEANLLLNLPVDAREYGVCKKILDELGVISIRLITNNPGKIEKARQLGITVTSRVNIEIPACSDNERYLLTKKEKMGHMIHNI